MPAVASGPPLSRLRSDLARLRRRRSLVRRGVAFATSGILLEVAAAAAFGIDYLGDLRPVARGVMFGAVLLVTAWVGRRLVAPWMGGRETETDVALLVERKQGPAGDLVAALQFQTAEAVAWGSPQLERAVVGAVDQASRGIAVFEGFSWKPLPGRLAVCGGLLLAIAAAAAVYPNYAAAFGRRLALADVSYPTKTVVRSVSINRREVDLAADTPVSVPGGGPLVFLVTADGVRPGGGEVSLENDAGGATTLPLRRDRDGGYRATLNAFTEPVTFVVRLGDGRAGPRRVELIPLPSVAIDLKPVPPAYARANAPAPPPPGVRTAFVLEGSDVEVVVRGTNKPLERVAVSVGDRSYPLSAADDGRTWSLNPAGTPLGGVRGPVKFTVSATDAHGLSPAASLKGSLRIRADRPPRVAAGAAVRRVIPTGRPVLSYGAADDFSVAAVSAKVVVTRAGGRVEERTVPLEVPAEGTNELEGRHVLELSGFGLSKGDTVAVTVEATDARGDRPGGTAAAEPVTFEVTDREGLVAGLLEADQEGAERLDEVIRRELGIGGGR